jgi:hypothetical protein
VEGRKFTSPGLFVEELDLTVSGIGIHQDTDGNVRRLLDPRAVIASVDEDITPGEYVENPPSIETVIDAIRVDETEPPGPDGFSQETLDDFDAVAAIVAAFVPPRIEAGPRVSGRLQHIDIVAKAGEPPDQLKVGSKDAPQRVPHHIAGQYDRRHADVRFAARVRGETTPGLSSHHPPIGCRREGGGLTTLGRIRKTDKN